MKLEPTWDLDCFFQNGSNSSELTDFLKHIENDIAQLTDVFNEGGDLINGILFLQEISQRLAQALSFIHCLCAQDVEDNKAIQLQSLGTNLEASFKTASLLLDERLAQLADEDFETLIKNEKIEPIAFPLEEMRKQSREKLATGQESIISSLAVDGFHGWSQMYDTLVGQMRICFDFEGNSYCLSAGQAHNKLSDPNRTLRTIVFKAWTYSWDKQKEVFARTLNHLAGFRLKVYDLRGRDSVLYEPLEKNRMQKETLHTMWDVVNENTAPFLTYMARKASLMSLPKLSWHDVHSPLKQSSKTIPYSEGAKFILEYFRQFSPKMADFAQMAFNNNWNEVEDRKGKLPGGFCTGFPLSKESRIFMTYSGTAENLATLAHELGHAYHNHIIFNLPELAQNYPMNIAETASTFAEQIISEAALKQASSKEEQLALLDQKVQRSLTFFMNIQARFLFEMEFYKQRQAGYVSSDDLCLLMEQAQKTAFKESLAEYDPYFWASKLHFFISSLPFYNFPYTFGYLFSLGLYARALDDPKDFSQKYDALLLDTGRMPVEQLAKKHLAVDLTKKDFWQSAMDIATRDVNQFLSHLTHQK